MNSSLYIHIPFCKKKCDYCDFYSIPESGRKIDGVSKINDLTDFYIDALLNEIYFYSDFYKIDSWNTVYIGGGTPSLLSSSQLEKLFLGIKSKALFSKNAEITIEMNPDDVRADFIETCKNVGINRISLGIQALDNVALEKVNRGCSKETAIVALDFLEENWNGQISVDFIAGLPSQTYNSFKNQFDLIFNYKKITHISLYTLTVEDGTPLGKKIRDGKVNFSFEKADKMWIKGRNILEKNGFFHYEISNFAKSGFESKHNSTYWKLENYIGCGAGASGTWYGNDFCDENAIRWTNSLSIPAYTDFWNKKFDSEKLPRKIEKLDKKTLEFEYLMMGFRMRRGVSANEFFRRFNYSIFDFRNSDNRKFSEIFSEWKENRLANSKIIDNNEYFFLNRRGILLLNRFLENLL